MIWIKRIQRNAYADYSFLKIELTGRGGGSRVWGFGGFGGLDGWSWCCDWIGIEIKNSNVSYWKEQVIELRERGASALKGCSCLSIFQSTYLDGMLLRLLPLDVDVDEWLKNSTSAFESKFVATWWLDGIDGKENKVGMILLRDSLSEPVRSALLEILALHTFQQ